VVHAFGLDEARVAVTSPAAVGVRVDVGTAVDFPSLTGTLSIGLGKEVGQLLWR
jgi:hypothetical protein